MEKSIWKPFVKYAAIMVFALLTINILAFFDLDGLFLVYMVYIYMPILLVTAPIGFGIYYAYYLSSNYMISLRNKIKISFTIFIISCATYAIPACEWLLGYKRMLKHALLIIFSPAALHALVFFCSITINQLIKKRRNMQSKDIV